MKNKMLERYPEECRKLGLNIAYYRKERGLTQIELAEKLDISRTHMSRIEISKAVPSLELIFTVSKVLDVPVSKLFEFR